MDIVLILIQKNIGLFFMICMGIALVKSGLLRAKDSKVISVVSLYLVLPCVIINSFQIQYTEELRTNLLIVLAVSLIINLAHIPICSILKKFCGMNSIESTSVVYSSTGTLVFPLTIALAGPDYVIYAGVFLCVQIMVLWTHGRIVISEEKHVNIKKILLDVNIISIAIGLLLLITGLQLPFVVVDTMDAVGATIGPLAMFVMGMLIGEADWKKVFSYPKLWVIVFCRLIALPAVEILLIKFSGVTELVPDGKVLMLVTVLALLTPPSNSITQLAQVHGKDADYASAITVLSTLLCIATMPLMVFFYQM